MEEYSLKGSTITRKITRADGSHSKSEARFDKTSRISSDLSAEFDRHWLQSSSRPVSSGKSGTIKIADLFAGCGGLSLGIEEAARALNLHAEFRLAVDLDADALEIYGANFPDANLVCDRVENLLDGELGSPLTLREKSLKKSLGKIDIVIGGPPCQGHSALNNHTRHTDDRNELYLRMARFCEVFKPDHVIIENVPGVLKDKSQVAQRTWAALESLGYFVESETINSYEIGVAQSRKRNITVASRQAKDGFSNWVDKYRREPRNLKWAIGDLATTPKSHDLFNTAPNPSAVNKARMDFLFDNGLFDLPDEERPDCHRLKAHSYNSVYGRLSWDKPSQTITTGFGGMGRGRYVHPVKRRTITPHEAARIQFFPDFFKFPTSKRTTLQMIIGNAVPPKLGYVIGLYLLR